MTQKIIISIVLVFSAYFSNSAYAGRKNQIELSGAITSGYSTTCVAASGGDMQQPVSRSLPNLPQDAHGKVAKIPHMEELPHIHRYHKERVKQVRANYNRLWFISKALIVICHLSLLWIAYLHLTH